MNPPMDAMDARDITIHSDITIQPEDRAKYMKSQNKKNISSSPVGLQVYPSSVDSTSSILTPNPLVLPAPVVSPSFTHRAAAPLAVDVAIVLVHFAVVVPHRRALDGRV